MKDSVSELLRDLESPKVPKVLLSHEGACSFVCWILSFKPLTNNEIKSEFDALYSGRVALDYTTFFNALNYLVANKLIHVGYLTNDGSNVRINIAAPSHVFYPRMVTAWKEISRTWSVDCE